MTTLRFQAVRDMLVDLLADPKYLGAQPGILAALHTWSQTLGLHPHVHCLVTDGGLTADGSWKAVRHGFLLSARVVMAVFRGKLLAAIPQAWARAELVLPAGQLCLNLLHRLGHPRKTPWNVHIMERYRHGAGVVTYLARVPAADVIGGGLSPALGPAYPRAPDTGGAVLRPVPSDAGGGPGRLPRGARAATGGGPGAAGLADSVCAAGRGPSRAELHLWAAPGVPRGDPAWGCAATCADCGACRMSVGLQGEAWQGRGVPVGRLGPAGNGLLQRGGAPRRPARLSGLPEREAARAGTSQMLWG
jgi:hypothetical protein